MRIIFQEFGLVQRWCIVIVAFVLLPGVSEASRYEVNYSGLNLTLTGFIDLDLSPEGTYDGSVAFNSVVESYEVRASGDLRGDFIFTPGNSAIGLFGRGSELDWLVTGDGIFITSAITSASANGPPTTEIVSTFAGNQWLRITDSFIDYRNNDNGGNQNTDYTAPFSLAFNTFAPNGGPFVSTLVPLPPAAIMFVPALISMMVFGNRRR
jgi:hypothetical protein